MAKITNFIATFVLIALFAVSLIIFAGQFAVDNSADINIYDEPAFGTINGSVSGNITNFGSVAQQQKDVFQEGNPLLSFGELIFETIPNIGKTLTNVIIGVFNAVFVQTANLLGIPPLIYTAIIGMLLVTIIFIVWRSIKTGT